jgi:hypothetical protein
MYLYEIHSNLNALKYLSLTNPNTSSYDSIPYSAALYFSIALLYFRVGGGIYVHVMTSSMSLGQEYLLFPIRA